MAEEALIVGIAVDVQIFERIALTVEYALERLLCRADRRPRGAARGRILDGHIDIVGHEEYYLAGLISLVDVLSERDEVVHIAYAVAAALNAVGAGAVQSAHGIRSLVIAAVAVIGARAAHLTIDQHREVTVRAGDLGYGRGRVPRAVELIVLHIDPRVECLEHIVAGVAVDGDGRFERALLRSVHIVLEVHAVVKDAVLIGLIVEIIDKAVEIVAVIEGRAV